MCPTNLCIDNNIIDKDGFHRLICKHFAKSQIHVRNSIFFQNLNITKICPFTVLYVKTLAMDVTQTR